MDIALSLQPKKQNPFLQFLETKRAAESLFRSFKSYDEKTNTISATDQAEYVLRLARLTGDKPLEKEFKTVRHAERSAAFLEAGKKMPKARDKMKARRFKADEIVPYSYHGVIADDILADDDNLQEIVLDNLDSFREFCIENLRDIGEKQTRQFEREIQNTSNRDKPRLIGRKAIVLCLARGGHKAAGIARIIGSYFPDLRMPEKWTYDMSDSLNASDLDELPYDDIPDDSFDPEQLESEVY